MLPEKHATVQLQFKKRKLGSAKREVLSPNLQFQAQFQQQDGNMELENGNNTLHEMSNNHNENSNLNLMLNKHSLHLKTQPANLYVPFSFLLFFLFFSLLYFTFLFIYFSLFILIYFFYFLFFYYCCYNKVVPLPYS